MNISGGMALSPRINNIDASPDDAARQPALDRRAPITAPPVQTAPTQTASPVPNRCVCCGQVVFGEAVRTACTACDQCGHSVPLADTTPTFNGDMICGVCRTAGYWQCDTCAAWILDDVACLDCDEHPDADQVSAWLIHGPSFTPVPRFHGIGPLFLGLELEVETPFEAKFWSATGTYRRLGSLGYLNRRPAATRTGTGPAMSATAGPSATTAWTVAGRSPRPRVGGGLR